MSEQNNVNLTDPFRTAHVSADDNGPNKTPIDVPKSAFESQEEVISRGMPKKNLKMIVLLLASAVVFGLLFWPNSVEKQVVTAAPVEKTEVEAAKSIVESLATAPKNDEPVSVKTTDSKDVVNPYKPATSDTDENGQPILTAAQKAAIEVKLREESIVSSSMIPPEFTLTLKKEKNITDLSTSLSPGQVGGTSEVDFLREQEAMAQRIIASTNSQNQNVSQKRDTNADFLKSAASIQIEKADRMLDSPPQPSLYQGTLVKGVLVNGINTQVPGEFKARVISDVFDSKTQRTLLIPRGSIIMGAYRSSILVGQSRMVLATQRLILPNGKSINLRGQVAGDRYGVAGLPGEVDNHFWEMFKASAIVGAASLLLPRDQQDITSTMTPSGSQQTGGTILARSLNDVITRIAERNASIGPTGSVDVGEIFTLMLQRDVAMEPYKW